MYKICFIYIDEPYHIFHSLGIAQALSENPDFKVTILCSERNYKVVTQNLNVKNCDLRVLRPFWYFSLPYGIEIKLQYRYFVYKKYRNLLSSFNAIICNLYNDLILKEIVNDSVRLIYAQHGFAGRKYSYDEKITQFDHFFIYGEKERQNRAQLNQLSDNNFTVIGHAKYELCKNIQTISPFENNKPIVFYNPHWEEKFGSFKKHGLNILAQFAKQNEYNLIFAPHTYLLTKNKSILKNIKKFEKFKNIYIDYGTKSSYNMNYSKISDFYIGDASSQVYEFLLCGLKPCIFLDITNAEGPKYEIESWMLGVVLKNSDNIIRHLKEAKNSHQRLYYAIQQEEMQYICYSTSEPLTSLASNGIENFLNPSN